MISHILAQIVREESTGDKVKEWSVQIMYNFVDFYNDTDFNQSKLGNTFELKLS